MLRALRGDGTITRGALGWCRPSPFSRSWVWLIKKSSGPPGRGSTPASCAHRRSADGSRECQASETSHREGVKNRLIPLVCGTQNQR